MLRIDRVLGSRVDAGFADALHDLEHNDAVDILPVDASELSRRHFRARTRGGVELAISLPRDQTIFDGAVLLLEDRRAIIVRANAERWLRLTAGSIADALELGHHAGNLHWRVRFAGDSLLVALEGPVEDYVERLGGLITERRVGMEVVDAGGPA